ncbi:MAG: right-handed parallel beta-helix repeat-containing protein, partial [Desulfobacterales bacterium]|nr:right-handed parallel beta-helix repeat-containing protein [Desulfobacterales bacterium]
MTPAIFNNVYKSALLRTLFLILFLILTLPSICAAATTVSSDITTDTSWTLAGSPYTVTTSIRVQGTDGDDGVTTLTIEPGVEVKFDTNKSLSIGYYSGDPGALIAQGTSDSRITFTSSAATPTPGNWSGILFGDTASNSLTILDYCDISYAAHGSGSLYIYKSNPTIKNSTIKYSSQAGIYIVQYGSPLIENCIIQNNETY